MVPKVSTGAKKKEAPLTPRSLTTMFSCTFLWEGHVYISWGPPPHLRDKSYLMSLNSMIYKSPKFFLSKFPGNLHIQSSLPLGLWFCICWATLINMSLLKFYNVNTLYFSKDFSGRKPVGFVSQTTSNGTVGILILENLHCRLLNKVFHCDKIYIAQKLPF